MDSSHSAGTGRPINSTAVAATLDRPKSPSFSSTSAPRTMNGTLFNVCAVLGLGAASGFLAFSYTQIELTLLSEYFLYQQQAFEAFLL